jgi:hypothetical protein
MKIGGHRHLRRSIFLAAACLLALVLTACTGRGGGQLPADKVLFKGSASFGFSFSCEDKGGINPSTGKLAIQLAYTDKGSNPIGASFAIHGTVDTINPVVESGACIGQNPPEPDSSALIFLGRYRLVSSAPRGFPTTACPTRETTTSPLCRFEVTVKDNDKNFAPSPGDFFSIKLSTVTASCAAPTLEELDPTCTQLPATSVFYARAGLLSSGNLTVD